MIHTIRSFLVVAFVSIFAPAHAEDSAKLRDFLTLVGFDTSLAAIPSGIIHSMENSPALDVDESMREAIGELVTAHFAPSGMKQSVVDYMANVLSDAQLDELSAYYSEGLGKRATELEIAAQQPGMEELVETEGREILQRLTDSSDERLLSYQRIVQSTMGLEIAAALSMNVTYAMLSGMMGSPQLPYSLTDEQILEIVNRQNEQIRALLTEAIFVTVAYTYREMSIDEVDAYATFLESDVVQTFYPSMLEALQSALVPRARAFGHDLMVQMGVRKT